MAGGQALTSSQGSVAGLDEELALTGSEITAADGTVLYDENTAEVVVGSESLTFAGDIAQGTTTTVRLRSRKVGGGAASFLLTGSFSATEQGAPQKEVARLLTGTAFSTGQGAFAKTRSKALTGSQTQSFHGVMSGGGAASWTVGSISLQEGTGQTFNVVATGPGGYAQNGIYMVNPTGTQLPTGMNLSEAGVVDVGTATASTTNNVVFTYHEPGSLPTLTFHTTAATTGQQIATAFPSEGAVPSGQVIVSPDDPDLRSSVISTWPDGSAKVVVIASGNTAYSGAGTNTVRLRPGTYSDANLTASRINALISSITINFGGGAQSITNPNFLSPERTWWANPRVICCRYRLDANVASALEAVIDIHAFSSNRAFVEIAIENSKIDSTAAPPSVPANATYTGATITVNGVSLSLGSAANSSSGPSGTHGGFRGWYTNTWVGGDPGIEVTHDTASMQAHPMFQKIWKPTDQNLQTLYSSSAYTPWAQSNLYIPTQGTGGDASYIGSLTHWDSQYLQSGDKYVRRATIARALETLTAGINWRDQTTGLVPTFTQIGDKDTQHTDSHEWPINGGAPYFEHAHSPAVGLMAFLCRPSPIFIEIAQRAAVFQITWRNYQSTYPWMGSGYQVRSRAWTLRAMNHAIFLTPDALAWKASAQTALNNCFDILDAYRNRPENTLGVSWNFSPEATGQDWAPGGGALSGVQFAMWQHHYLGVEMHKIAVAKTVATANQARANTLADWAVAQPVRWINESTSGEWRAATNYYQTISTTEVGNPVSQFPTWTQMRDWQYTSGTRPAATGPWLTVSDSNSWDDFNAPGNTAATPYYDSYFWATLCMAVERGISGADIAWQTIYGTNPTTSPPNGNLTNLNTWSAGGASQPRWCWLPRNK